MDIATVEFRKRLFKAAVIFFIAIFILSGAVFFAITKNGVSLYAVSGDSMEPTFSNGDSLIVQQKKSIQDGQIVFFKKPSTWNKYAHNDATLIKRVVAVPGDTITYTGDAFLVNGKTVYNTKENDYECDKGKKDYTHTLSNKEIFAMGDNSKNSLDSRRIFCDGQITQSFIPKNSVLNYGEVVFKF